MKLNNEIFVNNYINDLNKTICRIDIKKIIECKKIILKKIKKKRNIYVCGNGGSSSVSNHLLCDFSKGIKKSSTNKKLKPRVISFSSNTDLLTAISNDISYDKIFSYQLENFASIGDLLIIFSCSGNSKNILNVAKLASKKNLSVISFIGFSNKSILKNLSNIYVNLGTKNYGICEDVFQSILHILSQLIRLESSNKKIKIL